MGLENLEFEMNPEWVAHARDNPWLAFIPEFAQDSEGNSFMRPKGRSIPYRVVSEDERGIQTYVCGVWQRYSGEISCPLGLGRSWTMFWFR